jgi:hypothetical protein
MTTTLEDPGIEHHDRRRTRRRYATVCAGIATGLLVGGFLLSDGAGATRDLGVIALGYGIGVAVAAVFLAFGYDPRRRK